MTSVQNLLCFFPLSLIHYSVVFLFFFFFVFCILLVCKLCCVCWISLSFPSKWSSLECWKCKSIHWSSPQSDDKRGTERKRERKKEKQKEYRQRCKIWHLVIGAKYGIWQLVQIYVIIIKYIKLLYFRSFKAGFGLLSLHSF